MDTLPLTVETLESIPAEFHSLYTKDGDEGYKIIATNIRTQADMDRMRSALEKERNDHKQAKEKLKTALAGKTPEEIQQHLDELERLRASSNPSNDKEQADIKAKIDAATAMLKRELEQERQKAQSQEQQLQEYQGRERQRKIDDTIREAITKAKGIVPTAEQDILLFARFAFEITEDGTVITKDTHGIQAGLSPSVWLASMQESRPHWWGPTQGGGAQGSRAGVGSNPWLANNWNMTEQGRIYKENPEKAKQLAKLANSKIGATKPTVK